MEAGKEGRGLSIFPFGGWGIGLGAGRGTHAIGMGRARVSREGAKWEREHAKGVEVGEARALVGGSLTDLNFAPIK